MFEFAASMFIIAVAATFALAIGARRSGTPPEILRYGPLDPEAVCPVCGSAGAVHVRTVLRRRGFSTPRVIAGVLTGGLAVLAVGVHRHVSIAEAHCTGCSATWDAGALPGSCGDTMGRIGASGVPAAQPGGDGTSEGSLS